MTNLNVIVFLCFVVSLNQASDYSTRRLYYTDKGTYGGQNCIDFDSIPDFHLCILDGEYFSKAQNWTVSNSICRELGANLLDFRINISTETLFSRLYSSYSDESAMWIGLKLINGVFVWESDEPSSLVTGASTFMIGRFDPGEPKYDRNVEKCAALFKSGLIKLLDCETNLDFRCFTEKVYVSPIKHDIQCSEGWILNKNMCYKLFEETSTYQIAVTNCIKYDGDLATYDDLDLSIFGVTSGEYFVNTGQNPTVVKNYNESYMKWRRSINTDPCKYIIIENIERISVGLDCRGMKKFFCQRPLILAQGLKQKRYAYEYFPANKAHTLLSSEFNRKTLKCSTNESSVIFSKDNVYRVLSFENPEKYYHQLKTSNLISEILYLGLIQGYYRCEKYESFNEMWSKKIINKLFIYFPDVKTDYLYVFFKYPGAIEWTDMYSFVTLDYLQDWKSYSQIKEWFSTEDIYVHKILNVEKNENGTVVEVKINIYHKLERNLNFSNETEFKEYLKKNSPPLEKLSMKNMKLLNPFGCYKEIVVHGSVEYLFDAGLPGDNRNSDILCQLPGLPAKAVAKCQGDFDYGYRWVIINILDCITFKSLDSDIEDSSLTKNLLDLFRETSTNYSELLITANEIITEQPSKLTVRSNDISLLAAILDKSGNADLTINSNTGKTIVSIVDKILNAPLEEFERAQRNSAASISIMNSLENFVNKFTIDNSNKQICNFTWPSDNLVVHVFETSDINLNTNMRFGLLRPKLTNGTDQYIYNVYASEENEKNMKKSSQTITPIAFNADDDIEVALWLPDELYKGSAHERFGAPIRTSFIVYKTTSLFDSSASSFSSSESSSSTFDESTASMTSTMTTFETNSGSVSMNDSCEQINSMVIMSSIGGRKITNLKNKIKMKFRLKNKEFIDPRCVYAKSEKDQLHWLTDGLVTIKHNNDVDNSADLYIECESDHLTNFAVLAGYNKLHHSKTVDAALWWISMIGMILSIICLSFVIVGQILFKKFRRGQYHIAILNLSIALICVNLTMILGLDKNSPSSPSSSPCFPSLPTSLSQETVRCMIVAGLLHYFLLVAFSWMLIEAILQYYKFIKVFNTHISSFVLKTVLPAWILPAIIVIATAVIDYRQFDGFQHHCWLAKYAFYFAFLLPLGLIILVNAFVFVRIIKGISCDRPQGMKTNQSESKLIWLQVQAAICCFVIMGLTWTFAFFAYGKAATVMYFLFAIFNSLQGFFIFILFNLREKPVRKAWSSFFRKQAKHLQTTTGTSSNTAQFYNLVPINTTDDEKQKLKTTNTDSSVTTSSRLSKDVIDEMNKSVEDVPDTIGQPIISSFKKFT